VEQYLQRLSLEQKIGQRLLFGIPGTRVGERTRRLVREGLLGGVLLTKQNIAGREQLSRFTTELQELAGQSHPPVGLLVAVDQEGGRVSRLDLDRLSRSAAALHLPAPDQGQIREAIDAVLDGFEFGRGKLRITYTGGRGPLGSEAAYGSPTLIAALAPADAAAPLASIVTAPWTRN
jgi:hypothetical protein